MSNKTDNAANKRYIGDGVYADFDGFSIILTTEDGFRTTNTIILEPQVLVALKKFVDATEIRQIWKGSQ